MKKNYAIFVLLWVAFALSACDDGFIPRAESVATHEGYTAKLTGRIYGADSWPDYYQLVLAGFGESEYSVSQVRVSPDADGNVTLTLTDIGSDVSSIELCVTNRLRRRILTYQSTEASSAVGDTIYLEVGQVDANMYTAIQEQIFNRQCVQCHGGSTQAAAGLYLTEGNSYASLVNQPSTTVADSTRVIPGNSEWSILHQVLTEDNELDLPFYHGNILTSLETRLIDEWIDAGAKN